MISSRGPGETDDLLEALALEWGRLRAIRIATVGGARGRQKEHQTTAQPLPPHHGDKDGNGNVALLAQGAFAAPKDSLRLPVVARVSMLESVASGADVLCEMRVTVPSSVANETLGTIGGSVEGAVGMISAGGGQDGALPSGEPGLRGGLWCGWKQPTGSILSERSCGGSREVGGRTGIHRSTRISFSPQLELGPTLAYS